MDVQAARIAAMAERCRELLERAPPNAADLPAPLLPSHLHWMCEQIEIHADDWPETKLHRWIGFVQCAMIANGVLDLPGAKAMFNAVKNAYQQTAKDEDLLDHLNPDSAFEIDMGGQG